MEYLQPERVFDATLCVTGHGCEYTSTGLISDFKLETKSLDTLDGYGVKWSLPNPQAVRPAAGGVTTHDITKLHGNGSARTPADPNKKKDTLGLLTHLCHQCFPTCQWTQLLPDIEFPSRFEAPR